MTIHLRFLAVFFLFFIIACSEEKEVNFNKLNIKAIETISVSEITRNSAIATARINTDNGAPIDEAGFKVSSSKYTKTIKYDGGPMLNTFSLPIESLSPGLEHRVSSFATNRFGTAEGEEIVFYTEKAILATVTTLQVTNITYNSAIVSGRITDNGGFPVTGRGVCYSQLTENPRIENNSFVTAGTGEGSFVATLSGLSAGKRYYARAYAITEAGASYGNTLIIDTKAVNPPGNVTILGVSNITYNGAFISTWVEDDGGSPITERGIVFSSTTTNPTKETSSRATMQPVLGQIGINLVGLTANTTFYVKAYASNEAGTQYSNDILQFRTPPLPYPSGIRINTVSNITYNEAYVSTSVDNDGGSRITERGIVFSSTTSDPTKQTGTAVTMQATVGQIGINLTGLTANTTYYVKAYATNEAGTQYSNTYQFKTPPPTYPSGISSTVSNITSNGATIRISITSDGGAPLTSRGFVFSNVYNSPTVGNGAVANFGAGGVGSFSSNISGLLRNTTYYVRPFAVNSVGTVYGPTVQFRTLP